LVITGSSAFADDDDRDCGDGLFDTALPIDEALPA